MPVILFDIDGTLILTGRAGQFAMQKVASREPTPVVTEAESIREPLQATRIPSEISFAGRTDRSIIADYFRRLGIEPSPECWGRFTRNFLNELPDELKRRSGVVLPGVRETLELLAAAPQVQLGLLTGNLRTAARMKLSHYGLEGYFYADGIAMGGFGDEHLDRDDVARDALQDVRTRLHQSVSPDDIWIVGDTPRDVQCARAIGVHVVAVATGEFSVDALAATQPDLVLADLTQARPWSESLLG